MELLGLCLAGWWPSKSDNVRWLYWTAALSISGFPGGTKRVSRDPSVPHCETLAGYLQSESRQVPARHGHHEASLGLTKLARGWSGRHMRKDEKARFV